MFFTRRKRGACRSQMARLDALLDENAGLADSSKALSPGDASFTRHLAECAGCRIALEEGVSARNLLRESRAPETGPGEFFAAQVMTRIRAEKEARSADADFWNPMEILARKLVWTSALALLVVSTVLYEMKPAQRPAPRVQEIASDRFPEPVAQAGGEDEVLVSLAQRGR